MIDRIAQDILGILCDFGHAEALSALMAVEPGDSIQALVDALCKDEAAKFAFGRISQADRHHVAQVLARYALAMKNATKTPLNGAESGGEHQVDLSALESQNRPHNPGKAAAFDEELEALKARHRIDHRFEEYVLTARDWIRTLVAEHKSGKVASADLLWSAEAFLALPIMPPSTPPEPREPAKPYIPDTVRTLRVYLEDMLSHYEMTVALLQSATVYTNGVEERAFWQALRDKKPEEHYKRLANEYGWQVEMLKRLESNRAVLLELQDFVGGEVAAEMPNPPREGFSGGRFAAFKEVLDRIAFEE